MRGEELRMRVRQRARQAVRRVWPSLPGSWSGAPRRIGPALVQIGRLTGAAVLAYLGATLVSDAVTDLTAPLTALLVVQASTVGTLRMAFVRVAAVLTGVLVAIAVANYVGLSWWSLAAVIAASLLLARVLRLGEQSLETPISAMLILGVSAPELAAETRIAYTLIGAAVGVAFSVLLPAAIPNTRAKDSVRDVARSQAALLDQIAITYGSRSPRTDEARAWFGWVESIAGELGGATAAVDAVEENRKLNPRALVALRIHTELRDALQRLARCCAAERALIVMIERQSDRPAGSDGHASALRGAFSVVLSSVAAGLDAFGELVAADRIEPAERAVDRIREVVAETRAALDEMLMNTVESAGEPNSWVLHGSMIAAVDEILRQLDLEHPPQTSTAWSERPFVGLTPRRWLAPGLRSKNRGEG